MRKRQKIRIDDTYVLGELFKKMTPALFFRLFETDDSDTQSILAEAAREHAATTDRKFEKIDHVRFEFSTRIWPKE
jgi:hypothetical protein